MRIAFVACNRNRSRSLEDASFLYRCQNLAAALRLCGHDTTLTHVTRLRPWQPLDVAVFHRPRHTLALRALLPVLRRRGVRLIADVDDLVFDEALAEHSPGVVNGLVTLEKTQAMFVSNRRALAAFDMLTVSTAPLQDEAGRRFPQARIALLSNAIHYSWRALAPPVEIRLRPKVITYLPGTRSHDRDFATVAPVLQQLLQDHAQLKLHVTGPLQFALGARPDQVQHQQKVPFDDLYGRVRAAWLNLAPVESTPFTRCKSALKVIEAGFCGIPTVCSPLPDAEKFVGAGAIFAETSAQWRQQIERLLEPEHYAAAATGLREKVIERADVHAVARKFLQFVSDQPAAAGAQR